MATFTHPIAWFLETLRQWRLRERQALANQRLDDVTTQDLYHKLNTSFWYLPPPC